MVDLMSVAKLAAFVLILAVPVLLEIYMAGVCFWLAAKGRADEAAGCAAGAVLGSIATTMSFLYVMEKMGP